MTGILERELRAAFDAASELVQPAPGLADRARRARFARRRRQLIIGFACCTLVAAAGAYAGSRPGGHPPERPATGPRVLVRVAFPVSQVAVNGRYLYLASNSNGLVAVYDRLSGRLVRLVPVPGSPTWLSVGPGGLVWLNTTDGGGQAGGLLLLSPDLAERAVDTSVAGDPVVATSRQVALTPTQYGLLEVHMPAPGRPGRGNQRLLPGTSVGPSQNTAPNAWAGRVDGRVVVQVTDGYGYHIHLVIAGQPTRTFGGDLRHEVGAVTGTASALWVQTYVIKNSYAAPFGPLVRLDGELRDTTPTFVQRSPVLAKTEDVWSAGNTIWVATGAAGHSLVCFSASSSTARVITVQANGAVATLAATADTAYVITAYGETAGPSTITSYRVPAACR
jgi:hypothetical protein